MTSSHRWSFRVKVRRGRGAYICGEETALIESIEDTPANRAAAAVSGHRRSVGRPTVVNNVKTWQRRADHHRGSDWYLAMGTKRTLARPFLA